jgi:prepilin-type N-terminal cleavage/methylation domain-containing protein
MSRQLASRKVTGVTLIELMITIAIIGVIAAIAVPLDTDYIDTAREAARAANVKNITFLMESYKSDEGSYPRGATFPVAPNMYLQDADALTEIGWAKSAADQLNYGVGVTDSGILTVTATP